MRCKICKVSTISSRSKSRHCWQYQHCPKCHYLGKTGAGRKETIKEILVIP
jgi:hypothetical protein